MKSFQGADTAYPSPVDTGAQAAPERSRPHIIDNPNLSATTGDRRHRVAPTLMLTLVALSPFALGMVESFPDATETADIAEPCGPLYGSECVEALDLDDADMGLGIPGQV